MADIQQGAVVTVAADVIVNGAPAFARGEQVTVQQVAPNAQRPEYKYTVFSSRMNQWYQLRDADIMPPAPVGQQPPGPGAPPPYPPAGATRAGGASWDFSALTSSDWLVGIGGIVMFLGTFFYFWGFGVLGMLLGLGLIALVIMDKLAKVPQIADWQGLTWVYIIVGGVGTVLGAISLLNLLIWLSVHVSVTWYFTPVLELLASIAVLAGGLMRRKEGL